MAVDRNVRGGLVLGAAWGLLAAGPATQPRTTSGQAMSVGLAGAAGYLVGSHGAGLDGRLAVAVVPLLRLVPGAEEGTWRPLALSAVSVVGQAAAAGLVGRRVSAGGAVSLAGAGAVGAYVQRRRLRLVHEASPRREPLPGLLPSTAAAAGTTLAVAGAWHGVAHVTERLSGRWGRAAVWGARLAVAGGGYMAWRGARRVAGRVVEARDAVEPGFAQPPTSTTVSGGPASTLTFDEIGRHGRRFVSLASTPAQIDAVTSARTRPVRVYVGLRAKEPVDTAMTELRRTGGLARSLLVVLVPTGMGQVNAAATTSWEMLTGGDCATVVLQYAARPSVLAREEVGPAAERLRSLLAAIRDERDEGALAVYAESLGADIAWHALGDQAGLAALGVDRALLVGRPGSRTGAQTSGVSVGPITEVSHRHDPVPLFSRRALYARPGPPGDPLGGMIPWLPVVTWTQLLSDTIYAARSVPGEFLGYGHDYRAEIAALVASAYQTPEATAEQRRRLQRQLEAQEMEIARRASGR